MPPPHFDDEQEVIGEQVIEVKGKLLVNEEYQPVELMVGLIQVKEVNKKNGDKDFDLLAGAYGVGAYATTPVAKGDPDREEDWSMYLQLDSDEDKRNFDETLPAFGFALIKQTGGAWTGWLDEVRLTKKKPKAKPKPKPKAKAKAKAKATP